MVMAEIKKWIENRFPALFRPLCALPASQRVPPDIVSTAGFLIGAFVMGTDSHPSKKHRTGL